MIKKNHQNLPWLSKAIVTRNINERGRKKTKIAVLKYEKLFGFLLIQLDMFTLWGCFTLFPEVDFIDYYHISFLTSSGTEEIW